MGYDSMHIGIKTARDGYNLVAHEYKKYHTWLNSFDKNVFLRYIPRTTTPLDIIDLGAGDGRTWDLVKGYPCKRFVACDIAEKLLKIHPGGKAVERVLCDLNEVLPFEDESFDLAFLFFVLDHIEDPTLLFSEGARILRKGGRWIISHFLQRREFVRKPTPATQFKIEFYHHRTQDLENLARESGFELDTFPINERGETVGHIFVLTKK